MLKKLLLKELAEDLRLLSVKDMYFSNLFGVTFTFPSNLPT